MWKCLHDDPETSKLLKQIYGGSRPDISYPKVRTIPRSNLPPAFTTGAGGDARDKDTPGPRKVGKEYRVPKFGGTKPDGPAPIDSVIMRRRRASQIQEEQAINKERMDHYRPPFIKAVGEDEKERLAEKFEFGGGKALPPEMTGPVMPIPSQERQKAAEAKRVAGVMRRRKGLPEVVDDGGGIGRKDRNALPISMFDQVASEIEERQQFLLEARASGIPYEHEARIMAEIKQRMSEMKRLAPSDS